MRDDIMRIRMRAEKFKRTAITLGWMTLLLLWIVNVNISTSHAGIFFDTSFETCAVGTGADFPCEGWNDFSLESRGHLEVTNSLAFSGSKSVKGTFDNVNGSSQQPSITRNWTSVSHIFARFAFRKSSGFQFASNGITKMVRFKDDSGYPLTWVVVRYGQYAILMENPYDAPSCAYALMSGIAPSSTSWDQIEVEMQYNTPGQSNGLMRMWVNGSLRIEQLNKAYIGPTSTSKGACGSSNPSTVRLKAAQIFIQSGLGSLYYDRFAVGDTRIGLTTGTTTSDTTPPTMPIGVGVQ
jgi:hypothetical protein